MGWISLLDTDDGYRWAQKQVGPCAPPMGMGLQTVGNCAAVRHRSPDAAGGELGTLWRQALLDAATKSKGGPGVDLERRLAAREGAGLDFFAGQGPPEPSPAPLPPGESMQMPPMPPMPPPPRKALAQEQQQHYRQERSPDRPSNSHLPPEGRGGVRRAPSYQQRAGGGARASSPPAGPIVQARGSSPCGSGNRTADNVAATMRSPMRPRGADVSTDSVGTLQSLCGYLDKDGPGAAAAAAAAAGRGDVSLATSRSHHGGGASPPLPSTRSGVSQLSAATTRYSVGTASPTRGGAGRAGSVRGAGGGGGYAAGVPGVNDFNPGEFLPRRSDERLSPTSGPPRQLRKFPQVC